MKEASIKSRVKISKETREYMAGKLKDFFLNERDEEIGDLAASLLMDFFIENMAPAFYNQGIEDAIVLMKDKLEDLYSLQILK